MSKKITIFQFLKQTGRYKDNAEIIKLITNGAVKINEKTIKHPHYQFKLLKEKVFINDRPIEFSKKEFAYFAFNKPSGIGCQKGEVGNVYEYIDKLDIDQKIKNTLFPVGRLDMYSEGLVIITNDGKFAKTLLDPNNKIPKTYLVSLDKPISKEDIKKLEDGIVIPLKDNQEITNYKTKPAKIEIVSKDVIKITISEGKKRQIRRMLKTAGYTILKLTRIRIGSLVLGDLKPGNFKQIKKEEILK